MGIFSARVRTIQRARNRKIDRAGTPPFTFLNAGDIAVDTDGGGDIVDFEVEAKTQRYAPMDELHINNNSTSDLNVYINQRMDWHMIVRAGTERNFIDYPGIRNVRISKRNAAVTITAGQVETMVLRQPLDSDEQVRREATRTPLKQIFNRIMGM